MVMHLSRRKKIALSAKKKAVLVGIVVFSFAVSYFLPSNIVSTDFINLLLTVVGILFGLIAAFYFTNLWERFQLMKEFAADETANWAIYIQCLKIFNQNKAHKKWYEEQKKHIDAYLIEAITIEWDETEKADDECAKIGDSLRNVSPPKSALEEIALDYMFSSYSNILDANNKQNMVGRNRLFGKEWMVLIILGLSLVASLFCSKTDDIASIILTGFLTSTVFIMFYVIYELDDLSYGEELFTWEPYEKQFDSLGLPRYYYYQDIELGRIEPPKGIPYRTGRPGEKVIIEKKDTTP